MSLLERQKARSATQNSENPWEDIQATGQNRMCLLILKLDLLLSASLVGNER